MLVLLHALVIERGDELLDQFDKLLRLTDGRARRRVDEQRRKTARQRDELAALGRQLSLILLECAATGELPMDRVRSRRAAAATATCAPRCTPSWTRSCCVARVAPTKSFLATLKRLRAVRDRLIDEPVELLPKAWRAWVLDDNGRAQRTRYELGQWFVARDALRAGRLY